MQALLKPIDAILDRITMYRLVLYVLTILIVVAIIEALFGVLSYSPWAILLSTALAVATCYVVNAIGARLVNAATSVESVYVTAFILALILPPATIGSQSDALLIVAASAIAMASKYLLAPFKKHVFNPAAIGVYLTGLLLGGYASWWVAGNLALLPVVLLGGLAIAHKIRRFDLVLTFCVVATGTIILTTSLPFTDALSLAVVHTSLLFFAFVMLTEPLTTPPQRSMRLIYAVIVGVLFAPALHIGGIYSSPELALLIGNIFVFVVSPKGRHVLTLVRQEATSATTKDFVFSSDRPFTFQAGQFLEWTLPHEHPDARGTRRFFTIASSPTESEIRLGVKFYEKPSSFKRALAKLEKGGRIFATALGGEFVLPKDLNEKLVFIAGGIGITPFRSHLRSILDRREKRDITIFYSNRTPVDIAYQSILDEAKEQIGIKVVHVIAEGALEGMRSGFVSAEVIQEEVSDFKDHTFYISGPQGMVKALKGALLKAGVARRHIHTDYFIGLA
ncbi:MAG: hypothetical protein JWN18_756 [Parcubacteria group bacterium]|nr:hypothetical protein [Parcubacteria group bacterium]